MIPRLSLLAAAATLALAGGAHAAATQAADSYLAITGSVPEGSPAAEELAPLNAYVVSLGEGSAVAYYTFDVDGADLVRVVTTVATGVGGPARLVSYLSPGQKAEVSLAGAVGTDPTVLELAYNGGLLEVRSITAQPEG